ncbi:MAG: hypothetical protein ABI330_02345 [Caldimonas sp.]
MAAVDGIDVERVERSVIHREANAKLDRCRVCGLDGLVESGSVIGIESYDDERQFV